MSITSIDCEFEALLDYLKLTHGFDFTGYSRSHLMRRIEIRMQQVGIEGISDYHDYLQAHPQEFTHLFNTIEINFSGFFRDAESWDYIATQIVPQIVASKSESDPIRVWSAGCATGEETYTLAIVLAQVLGVEQYLSRVKILATDVDLDALKQARMASYRSDRVVGIPTTLLSQYFQQVDKHYVFRSDLRRPIIFSRHNLIADAPMSKIDLLACRNVLIYFNIEAQARVLARFHFGLKDSGFLFLGKAEMLPDNFFTSLDIQHRVLAKVPKNSLNQRLLHRAISPR
ncbi:protein-glutamate O-methyltransferase CheR [Chroococcidiopsis sp. FACHB-1243]|uniref:CheR family methyltransferase n=1 Tax=Chroococcidiopsis sp. [FACHB-1243] TaxID=2692781 RepID=UPI00177D5135|nr:protein-glutamate O-methyltransferase CheR [Chroococcidiopsis sp. [FACHB-1243]]MBD2309369.1 protein-glutamate O-methyltransferase CheR [Chroococcidiopsis sp. [FACHB-1243]]